MIYELILCLPFILYLKSCLKYLFIILYLGYFIIDYIVKYNISSDDYISYSIDVDEFDDVIYSRYKSKDECIHSLKSMIRYGVKMDKVILFYKIMKTINDPLERMYRRLEYIYIPQSIYAIDNMCMIVIYYIRDYITTTRIYNKIKSKITDFIIKRTMRMAIQGIKNIPKDILNKKDKKKLNKTLMKQNLKKEDIDNLLNISHKTMNKLKQT